jgi:hypothetical protein
MDKPLTETDDLPLKIRRLVQERGWNQEDLAKKSRLNRHTARTIMVASRPRKLRNSTVNQIARALNLTVNELREQPLERLLPRMAAGAGGEDVLRRRYAEADHPELKAWIERNPGRARDLADDELAEVIAVLQAGGTIGVEGLVARIERRRKVLRMAHAVAGTEYIELLEQIVALLHEKVRPAPARP